MRFAGFTGTAVVFMLLLLSACSSSDGPVGQGVESDTDAGVKVRLNPQADEACIAVRVASQVKASGEKRGVVSIVIENQLEEEVFVAVTGFDSLAFSFSYESADGKAFATVNGGGAFVFFPDNTHLFKRLHAGTRTDDGRFFLCGCCATYIDGKISDKNIDLKSWAKRDGAQTTVTIPITGYLRQNGRTFSADLEVPITLKDNDETGAVRLP